MMQHSPQQGKQQLQQGEDETSVEAMRRAFAKARTSPRDLWFEREDGKILTALVNGDRGWLMYRVDEDDAGYSSRDPTYAGPEEAVLPYILANGQQDEYPVSWTLPIEEVMRATEYFLETGEKAPWVTWHDDYFPQECVHKMCDLLLSWNSMSVKRRKRRLPSWNDSRVNVEKGREKRVSVEKVQCTSGILSSCSSLDHDEA